MNEQNTTPPINHKATTISFEYPKWPVGTVFTYRTKRDARKATVVGYDVHHTTDTGETWVTYRIRYDFVGQIITATVPRATVDRAMLKEAL